MIQQFSRFFEISDLYNSSFNELSERFGLFWHYAQKSFRLSLSVLLLMVFFTPGLGCRKDPQQSQVSLVLFQTRALDPLKHYTSPPRKASEIKILQLTLNLYRFIIRFCLMFLRSASSFSISGYFQACHCKSRSSIHLSVPSVDVYVIFLILLARLLGSY